MALSYRECVDFLLKRLQSRQGGWVVTLNLEILSTALIDEEYASWVRSADIVLADGMPLVWASKLKRGVVRIDGRTTGSDISADLIQAVAEKEIAIIGGVNPPRALEALKVEKHEEVFVFDGIVKLDDTSVNYLIEKVKAHGAKLIFVALGVPKQDYLAVALRKAIPDALILGVGGTFELIAGLKPRAPRWMQRYGLEWLWRLFLEPRRLWRRYLVLYWVGAINLIGDILFSRSPRDRNRAGEC